MLTISKIIVFVIVNGLGLILDSVGNMNSFLFRPTQTLGFGSLEALNSEYTKKN